MRLKHRVTSQVPSVDKIKEEAVKQFGQDLAEIVLKTFRDIYDDLNRVQVQIVDSLPTTAQEDNRGIFYLRRGTGGATDELYMLIDTGATTGNSWGFKKITLT